MPLLTLIEGSLAYGELPLLDRASFSLESGERLGLIGRNGTGKSSLLAVIAGNTALDDGELRRRDGLSIALVEQEPALPDWSAIRKKHKLAAFLDRVATRILELDRGRIFSFPGNYSRYEALKAGQLEIEAVVRRKFDKFWAQEEAWIRKG